MKALRVGLVVCALLVGGGVAAAQDAAKKETPKNVGEVLDQGLSAVEKEFVPAVEAMPEDKFSFAPATGEMKGVRTFAQQVKHVAAVNYLVGAAILEEKPPVELGGENGPDSVKSKAEIVKFLKDSFAYVHKAELSVTDANMLKQVKSPFGDGTWARLAFATLISGHCFDHYGQMALYLRMNGIVPPASRQ